VKTGSKVVIKVGRGAAGAGSQILELAEKLDAVCVMSPSSVGIIPDSHPRCMGVGGSKGSISGNYAMENADTLIVIGSRAVCQSDCSRTGYPQVHNVINLSKREGYSFLEVEIKNLVEQ
jgi:3D-(3,5/4)-trihydroxycyclohexane-1,2-dione acylhydrolase (decyclizing)